jgi:hypothetical protein
MHFATAQIHECLRAQVSQSATDSRSTPLQGARQKAKAEKMAKLRAGEKAVEGSKPKELKDIAKKFYGQLVTDSHYVGEDYDVFGAWLGAKKADDDE